MPLVTPERAVLGTLNVLGRVPRTLTDEQREALYALGRLGVAQSGLRQGRNEWALAPLSEAETQHSRAEEALQEHFGFLRTLVDSAAEGVYALDTEWRITFINLAAQ